MSRARDYAYEALAEVTGTDMSAGRGELNAALKSIREQTPGMGSTTDSMPLAMEIHTRAGLYRKMMPEVVCTPTALAKHWKRVFEEADRKTGTNLSASSDCPTCDGDRFVLVATRPAKHGNLEEFAPCPDCGPKEVSHYRYDGQLIRAPDPERTREMMNQ
jgi:hypothetical protein